ncbi:hypothetical protein Ancab_038827 [Ancistrocladus abbreviatus]
MDCDWKKGIMSFELAMQREMAYREKLQRMILEQGGSSRNNPVPPKQMPVTAPSRVPRPLTPPGPCPSLCLQAVTSTAPCPRQSTIPSRGPSTGPSWRPLRPPNLAPSLHPRPRPSLPSLQGSGPIPRTGPLPRPNLMHQMANSARTPTGRPNMMPRPRPQLKPNTKSNARPLHSGQKRKEPSNSCLHNQPPQQLRSFHGGHMAEFFCTVCNVDCQSECNMKTHLVGHKHTAKLKLLESGSEHGPNLPRCELCKIWCMNKDALRQHINGRNHILNLHAAQMKMKG